MADHDRPLNKRGRRDGPRMGRLIATQQIVPDLILSSTAERARQTAEAVAGVCDCGDRIELIDSLYLADAETIIQVLHGVADRYETLMAVGHNPGIEQLLAALTHADMTMPTAALAELRLNIDRWGDIAGEGGAECVHLWLPRQLEAD